jgi:hypothetical protein
MAARGTFFESARSKAVSLVSASSGSQTSLSSTSLSTSLAGFCATPARGWLASTAPTFCFDFVQVRRTDFPRRSVGLALGVASATVRLISDSVREEGSSDQRRPSVGESRVPTKLVEDDLNVVGATFFGAAALVVATTPLVPADGDSAAEHGRRTFVDRVAGCDRAVKPSRARPELTTCTSVFQCARVGSVAPTAHSEAFAVPASLSSSARSLHLRDPHRTFASCDALACAPPEPGARAPPETCNGPFAAPSSDRSIHSSEMCNCLLRAVDAASSRDRPIPCFETCNGLLHAVDAAPSLFVRVSRCDARSILSRRLRLDSAAATRPSATLDRSIRESRAAQTLVGSVIDVIRSSCDLMNNNNDNNDLFSKVPRNARGDGDDSVFGSVLRRSNASLTLTNSLSAPRCADELFSV